MLNRAADIIEWVVDKNMICKFEKFTFECRFDYYHWSGTMAYDLSRSDSGSDITAMWLDER